MSTPVPQMNNLTSYLTKIESLADAVVQNENLLNSPVQVAKGVNVAATVLGWIRFVRPIVEELERTNRYFDFKDVESNGYRSLLAVLQCSSEKIHDNLARNCPHSISEDQLRVLAQSCELVFFGIILREFAQLNRSGSSQMKHDLPSTACEFTSESSTALIQTCTTNHECFQRLAAKCSADIESRHYALANISFGYSLTQVALLRLVQAAFVIIHKFEAQESSNAKEENGDIQLHASPKTSGFSIWDQIVSTIKGFTQTVTLALPLRKIDVYRITEAAQVGDKCSVKFVQKCWNLSERTLIHAGNLLTAPSIDRIEILYLSFGEKKVSARLICPKVRGQRKKQSRLVLHAHGSGFVAHTSKSHEAYLRRIANDLETPILSIDYSLAPEASFPTALNECFAVYNWLCQSVNSMKTSHLQRQKPSSQNDKMFEKVYQFTTSEVICFLGDSAGGNLLLSVLRLAIERNLPLPIGFVGLYTPMLLDFALSPSRVLTLIDPLIPSRILAMCIMAYLGRDLDSTLENLEAKCPIHANSMGETNASVADEFKLCNNCSSLIVAGHSIYDWLFELNRLRASLFSHSTTGIDRKKRERAACAFTKLHVSSLWKPQFAGISSSSNADASSQIELSISEPLIWPDSILQKLPRIALITPAMLDPTIDDNVDFANRLSALGVSVTYDAVKNVPHGFMNFANVCSNASSGLQLCVKRMSEVFGSGSK